jgi:hypothetical protein
MIAWLIYWVSYWHALRTGQVRQTRSCDTLAGRAQWWGNCDGIAARERRER